MSKICWLHLSDMHISSKNSFDQNLINDALLEDLKSQISKHDISLSFVFFTGDVASTASKEDYSLAKDFFAKLCKQLDFNKNNLFIVPGNHDVNRYKVSKLLDDSRRELDTREEIKKIIENQELFDSYLSRFDNYSEFIGSLYGKPFKMNSKNYYFSETRTVNEVDFGIIGLNSAWSSYGGRHDCNNIYISETQLTDAIEKVKTANVKIVLIHHPLSWLYEEDKSDVENLLFKHCQVILHGHLHRADFQIVNSIKGEQIIIPAGAIYTGRRVSNSYNITTIDFENKKISILPRRYYDGARKFLTDIETLGNDDISSFEVKISGEMMSNIR